MTETEKDNILNKLEKELKKQFVMNGKSADWASKLNVLAYAVGYLWEDDFPFTEVNNFANNFCSKYRIF